MRVLVVNAGSSSLKLRVLDGDDLLATAGSKAGSSEAGVEAIHRLLDDVGQVQAVGHRVVHGGSAHVAPELVTPSLVDSLRELVELAPLHQPAALHGIEVAQRALPGAPAVACFDTAFHATLPKPAATYAIPADWRERFGLRRYGFHGLSHAYASRRARELVDGPVRRVVVAHLGAGASLCAVLDGRSVDTTMGFTPLEGLVMATRSGSVDPGLLLWLIRRAGLPVEEVEDTVDRRSGMLALAGTKDMRDVVMRAENGDGAATLALDVYVHRLRGSIAAMAASLGGLDVLVFTGGIGERSDAVRARTVEGLEFLGAAVDPAVNARVDVESAGDADVSADGAAVRTLVVGAREDLEIVRGVRSVVGQAG